MTPADGETLAFPGQPPVFSWGALAGVSSYTLEIDDAPDFVSPTAYTTVNTSFVLSTPQPAGQSYYWRVQGVTKDKLVTAFSATRSYQTEPVAQPVSTYPGNTTEPAIKDVVISWKPVAGAVSYHLQVSPNVDFTNNTTDVLSVKGTRWSPDKTLNNGSYWWRVRARDAAGAYGAWSGPEQFRRAWPERPNLLWPSDSSQVSQQGPTFRWSPIQNADRYELNLGTDHNFTPGTFLKCYTNHTAFTPQMTVTQSTQSLSIGLDPDCFTSASGQLSETSQPRVGIPYYWRVRGLDNPTNVLGVFSDIRSFTYTPLGSGTGGLRLLAPEDGAIVTVPTLSWTSVPGATTYGSP